MGDASSSRLHVETLRVGFIINLIVGYVLVWQTWVPDPTKLDHPRGLGFLIMIAAAAVLYESCRRWAHRLFAAPSDAAGYRIVRWMTEDTADLATPGKEMLRALIASACQLAVGLGLWAMLELIPGLSAEQDRLLRCAVVLNIGMAAFNVLPITPLDGGRLLEAGLWALTGSRLQARRFTASASLLIIVAGTVIILGQSARTDSTAVPGAALGALLASPLLLLGAVRELKGPQARQADDAAHRIDADAGAERGAASGEQAKLRGLRLALPLNLGLGYLLVGRTSTSGIAALVAVVAIAGWYERLDAAADRRFTAAAGFAQDRSARWYQDGRADLRTPGQEALRSLFAPAVMLVVSLALWALLEVLTQGSVGDAGLAWAVALVGVGVGVLNLLPLMPLNGGRVLAAGLWALTGSWLAGRRIAAYVTLLLVGAGFLLSLGATVSATGSDLLTRVIAIAMGLLLGAGAMRVLSVAGSEVATVGRVAFPAMLVPANSTLDDLDAYVAGSGLEPDACVALLTEPDFGLCGYVRPARTSHIDPADRAGTELIDVAERVSRWRAVGESTPVARAVGLMSQTGEPLVVVDELDRPIGMLLSAATSG